MVRFFKSLFRQKPRYKPGPPPPPKLILSQACLHAFAPCMADEIEHGLEGVAYLLGQSDGTTTLAIAAIRPKAVVTRGSFAVSAPAVAEVVRAANKRGLQVVGQVHTHPRDAFHSDGDEDGARIAYTGFVSIVLPDYGRHLPSLDRAAAFFYRRPEGFIPLDIANVVLVEGQVA